MSDKPLFSAASIQGMERGISVLRTFGEPGNLLKKKMAITGFFCRLLLFSIFHPAFLLCARAFPVMWQRRKKAALRFIRWVFPFNYKGEQITPTHHGQVVVINHPTLNDPICAILYALDIYPDRAVIVPVNLPWYETICRYRAKLRRIGINIVPILTPETAKRLGANDHVAAVQSVLMKNYTAEFAQTLSAGGLAVVAQQATRQRFIFSSPGQAQSGVGILSTISLVLAGLRRDKLLDATCFIPIGVIPHQTDAKPRLNPFCRYTLSVGEPILAADLAAVKNDAKRPADLYILQRLAELLPENYRCNAAQEL